MEESVITQEKSTTIEESQYDDNNNNIIINSSSSSNNNIDNRSSVSTNTSTNNVTQDITAVEASITTNNNADASDAKLKAAQEKKARTLERIQHQVEYYFSLRNLPSESLMDEMSDEGWIPLESVRSFGRLDKMVKNTSMIIDALERSAVVELSPNRTHLRPIEWDRLEFNFDDQHQTKTKASDSNAKLTKKHGKRPPTCAPTTPTASSRQPTTSISTSTESANSKRATKRAAIEVIAPCKYHIAGYCLYGNSCRDSHDMSYANRLESEWLSRTLDIDGFRRITQRTSKLKATQKQVLEHPEPPTKQPFRYYVVIDLEGRDEIIEFPALLFDTETMQDVGRFHRWVRPRFLFRGCAINPESSAVPWTTVLEEFNVWLRERVENPETSVAFVTCGNWDIGVQIPSQCKISECEFPPLMNQWINIKTLFSETYKKRARGMHGMLGILHALGNQGEIQNGIHHLGMHDVEQISLILANMILDGAVIGTTTTLRVTNPDASPLTSPYEREYHQAPPSRR